MHITCNTCRDKRATQENGQCWTCYRRIYGPCPRPGPAWDELEPGRPYSTTEASWLIGITASGLNARIRRGSYPANITVTTVESKWRPGQTDYRVTRSRKKP